MEFEPIGTYRSRAVRKYDAPRQGIFAGGVCGTVELCRGRDFETALRDLDGFERIWLLFVFDRNGAAWRPTTRPPIETPGRRRIGTFASRSPYRPNPIGLSCVRLLSIEGRTLTVADADLLDGTPILDIKPYLPAADAFPAARAGWVDEQHAETYEVLAAPEFLEAAQRILALGGPDLLATARTQLMFQPLDDTRKRVEPVPGPSPGGILSLRMFRIRFVIEDRLVRLLELCTGYDPSSLAAPDDPYHDKDLHRRAALRPL